MSVAMQLILIALSAYLLGSISSSIIFTKLFLNKDIRDFGSGNAGTTNVLRSAGKLPALLTLLGDFGKAAVAVLLVRLFLPGGDPVLVELGIYLAGFCCLMGHLYPLYYGFKGGKGVLVSATMILFIDWRVFLVEIGLFILLTALSGWVSLGSVAAAIAYPFATWLMYNELSPAAGVTLNGTYAFLYENQRLIASCIAAVFGLVVVIKHRGNIKRIIRGEERKLSFKKGA